MEKIKRIKISKKEKIKKMKGEKNINKKQKGQMNFINHKTKNFKALLF
jgi:hypothetical protein